MADCVPFRAWRYQVNGSPGLALLVAPPYDVISPEEDEQLHRAHEHNIVHLTRSRVSSQDTAQDNAYTRARHLLETWCAAQVLQQDREPAFYLYEQRVEVQGVERRRLGFLGLTRLVEPSSPDLMFHERTFAGPRDDRLRLIQAVQANLSPVFSLFSEPARGPVMSLLHAWTVTSTPTVHCAVRGETHRLWRVVDPMQIEALHTAMRDRPLLIADGHHRYEAAWLNREAHPWVLNFCSWLEDPDLVILPMHRAIARRPPGLSTQAMCARIARCGDVVRVAHPLEAMERLARDMTPGLFGYCTQGATYVVRVDSLVRQDVQRQTPVLGELDVVVLHEGLFPRVYGSSGLERLEIEYIHDGQAAAQAVNQGAAEDAWLLRPISATTIEHLARQRVRLPQKSTYFFPKLLTGLVLYRFEGA